MDAPDDSESVMRRVRLAECVSVRSLVGDGDDVRDGDELPIGEGVVEILDEPVVLGEFEFDMDVPGDSESVKRRVWLVECVTVRSFVGDGDDVRDGEELAVGEGVVEILDEPASLEGVPVGDNVAVPEGSDVQDTEGESVMGDVGEADGDAEPSIVAELVGLPDSDVDGDCDVSDDGEHV